MKNSTCITCGFFSGSNGSLVCRFWKDRKFYCNKHYTQMLKYGSTRERTPLTKNNIRCTGKVCEMDLYDAKGNVREKTFFSARHLDTVKKYKWSFSGYAIHTRTGTLLHILITGCKKPFICDHINGNKLDNRDENLRIVNWSQNGINKSKQTNNTSGYTGIDYDKKNKKWKVRINRDKKGVWLGRYDTLVEAVKVRKEAEIKYFGEYAPNRV